MRKISVFAFILVIALYIPANASQFELYGGISYNAFDLEEVNEWIEQWADEFQDESDSLEQDSLEVSLSKPSDITSGWGGHAGGRYWITPEFALGAEVDYLKAGSSGKLTVEGLVNEDPVITRKDEISVSVDASTTGYSIVGTFKPHPNLMLFASGGQYYLTGEFGQSYETNGGQYYLTGEFGQSYETNETSIDDDSYWYERYKIKIEDKTLGFKLGGVYEHPINDQLSAFARAAYRRVSFDELEYAGKEEWEYFDSEEGIDEGSEEFEVDFDLVEELDFSGLEISIGVQYSF